ncbi:prepilin peptidase [Agrococcus sp. DT81.2]|uniref:prepilin peptidase n=1 Tax=Agrococcus sp. DT81.2 TaxID=3393414 RepID=UPI003CE48773
MTERSDAAVASSVVSTSAVASNVVSSEGVAGSAARPLGLRWPDALGLPLAAAAAALLAAAGADAVAVVPLAAAVAAAPALARIDTAQRRLPNPLTVPLLVVGAAACAVRLAQGDLAPLAAVGSALVLLVMAVAGGMGMGDVKLGAALALVTATVGWAVPLAGLAASIVVGGVAGGAALSLGRRSVAFGPALLVGHAVAVVVAMQPP